MCVHYRDRYLNETVYEEDLTEMEPYLRQLSKISNIVWWNNDPTMDFLPSMPYADPSYRCNQIAKRVFKYMLINSIQILIRIIE